MSTLLDIITIIALGWTIVVIRIDTWETRKRLAKLILAEGPLSGRDLRKRTGGHGLGFYRMMFQLEDAGEVEGWYEPTVVANQVINQRHYKLKQS